MRYFSPLFSSVTCPYASNRGLVTSGNNPSTPTALIIVLLGQSLNTSRGTNVLATSSNPNAYMPVDGVAVPDFTFFTANNDFSANWASFASAIPLVEGAGQSPCVGIANMLTGAATRTYIVSVSVGARGIDVLASRGERANVYAACHRFCDLARADGLEPKIIFYSAHGEADAANNNQAVYYARAMDYYKSVQLAAAQAVGDPAYIAPIILTYPLQQNAPNNDGSNDRVIKAAIKQIGETLSGAVMLGPIYQWPANSDRVHPTDASYVLRGEAVGKVIANLVQGVTYVPLTITNVSLAGTTFTITWSHQHVRDATLGVGTNLNTANALDGIEWLDNGSFIKIVSLVHNTDGTSTGTLNSTPVGSIGQQVLRIASQSTASALISGVSNLPGSLIRKDNSGWLSSFDPSYRNYDWASPQSCSVVAA